MNMDLILQIGTFNITATAAATANCKISEHINRNVHYTNIMCVIECVCAFDSIQFRATKQCVNITKNMVITCGKQNIYNITQLSILFFIHG